MKGLTAAQLDRVVSATEAAEEAKAHGEDHETCVRVAREIATYRAEEQILEGAGVSKAEQRGQR